MRMLVPYAHMTECKRAKRIIASRTPLYIPCLYVLANDVCLRLIQTGTAAAPLLYLPCFLADLTRFAQIQPSSFPPLPPINRRSLISLVPMVRIPEYLSIYLSHLLVSRDLHPLYP